MELIIKLRKENNKTQKEIANLLGIDRTTYCKKEKGLIEFRISEINLIKDFFNLSNDDVIKIFFTPKVESNSTCA